MRIVLSFLMLAVAVLAGESPVRPAASADTDDERSR